MDLNARWNALTCDIADVVDLVMERAREDFLRGKDFDPGDFVPPVYVVDALDELLENENVVLTDIVTRTAVLDACQARL